MERLLSDREGGKIRQGLGERWRQGREQGDTQTNRQRSGEGKGDE